MATRKSPVVVVKDLTLARMDFLRQMFVMVVQVGVYRISSKIEIMSETAEKASEQNSSSL
jgi:hypothetical protein